MATDTKHLSELLESVDSDRVCESPSVCDNPATYLVWCDHHVLGCNYTGFRCDIHRNLLELETRREIDRINAGAIYKCFNCKQMIRGGLLTDHFRYIPL